MLAGMLFVEATALAVLLAWFVLVTQPARRWPGVLPLERPAAAGSGLAAGEGRAVALVPARNEAEMLPTTLPTLLRQCPPLAAVVLIDDGSSDGTAETARRTASTVGAADRLCIVTAEPTPPDWSGKLHALDCGRRQIDATWGEGVEWILVTDADIAHREGSVVALLELARRNDLDLVSVMARLRAETFWERLLVPPFVYFFHLLYPFRHVSSRRSRVAAAAGGCMLIRREALERAGGFAAIRSALIDDVALARAVERAGGRLWLGLDAGVRSVRAYGGLGSLWRMVERSAFVQLGHRWSLLVATLTAIGVGLVGPAAVAVAVGLASASGAEVPAALGRTAVWSGAGWGLQTLSVLPFVRHHGVPVVFAAALPLAALLYAAMTLSSALRHLAGRGVAWKGRTYHRRERCGRKPSVLSRGR